jgi:hypothetical protein
MIAALSFPCGIGEAKQIAINSSGTTFIVPVTPAAGPLSLAKGQGA